jgi:8-oxo-dGTP diphosphatase
LDESSENIKVASIFLLRDDGALLLQHRDNKPGLPLAGKWVPPGGHCEAGEDIKVCARRELSEETGYKCDRLHLLYEFIDRNVEGHAPYPLTVFWATFDGVQKLECSEGQALEFIERERALSYDIPSYLITIWDQVIAASNKKKQNMSEEKK